jgi:hypothetical protein
MAGAIELFPEETEFFFWAALEDFAVKEVKGAGRQEAEGA